MSRHKVTSSENINGEYEVLNDNLLVAYLDYPYSLSICLSAHAARRRNFAEDSEDTIILAKRLIHRLYDAACMVDSYIEQFAALWAAFSEYKDRVFDGYRIALLESESDRDEVERRMYQNLAYYYTILFDEYIVNKGIAADGWRINRHLLAAIFNQRNNSK